MIREINQKNDYRMISLIRSTERSRAGNRQSQMKIYLLTQTTETRLLEGAGRRSERLQWSAIKYSLLSILIKSIIKNMYPYHIHTHACKPTSLPSPKFKNIKNQVIWYSLPFHPSCLLVSLAVPLL